MMKSVMQIMGEDQELKVGLFMGCLLAIHIEMSRGCIIQVRNSGETGEQKPGPMDI
jgi:hypothetical protein